MGKLLKSLRYRIEWLALAAMAALIPLLPRRAAHGLGQILGHAGYLADYRGRRTALENLRCVFGDRFDERQRRRVAREAFQHFTHTLIDQFWSCRLTAENYPDYCDIEMDDPAAIERARETGAIWVTPHYSNFEWIALVMGFRGYRFTIIAQDFKNPLLTGLFQRNREVSGHQVIPQRRALIRLLKNLKSGGHAAFLTDLNIRPGRAATLIHCLGHQTCVTALHAELMRRTQLPVIPGICIPLPGGRYRMRGLKPLTLTADMTDRQIAQACWDAFEPFIREHPAPWLWMYKHWRYRPAAAGDQYPTYATRSPHFDRLARKLEPAPRAPESGRPNPMNSETETLTQALADGRFEEPGRSRLTALLADVDLPAWFAAVDDSPYALEDWLRALLAFDGWLASRGETARPVASMLGYIECGALATSTTLPLPEFSALLIGNLERYGFDAVRPATSQP